MTRQLAKPKRRNPLRRTQVPTLPPMTRSRKAHVYTLVAAEGRFALQQCVECGTFVYPARDVCPSCLAAEFRITDTSPEGVLLTETTIEATQDLYFRERLPWRVGLVAMNCGPKIVCHLHGDCRGGDMVRVNFNLDKSGNAAAFASPAESAAGQRDDHQWREMLMDPKYRRVLITDGRTAVGQEMAIALADSGASVVHVGVADSWKPFPGEKRLSDRQEIRLVPLDIADQKSVEDLARDIGGKTDILINTSAHVRPGGLLTRSGTAIFREEIEQSYLGFVHLAQSFGPIMRARGADGVDSAAAWVNVLSVFALANWSSFGSFSASQAACLSLSHCLRSELRSGGVKVLNVFTGPVDTEWFQMVPPPKVAPRVVATSVIKGLREGLEDFFVGDVADDIKRRLQANPKALERELGG